MVRALRFGYVQLVGGRHRALPLLLARAGVFIMIMVVIMFMMMIITRAGVFIVIRIV